MWWLRYAIDYCILFSHSRNRNNLRAPVKRVVWILNCFTFSKIPLYSNVGSLGAFVSVLKCVRIYMDFFCGLHFTLLPQNFARMILSGAAPPKSAEGWCPPIQLCFYDTCWMLRLHADADMGFQKNRIYKIPVVVHDWQKLASSCSHFSQILLAHSDLICYQPLARYVVEPF